MITPSEIEERFEEAALTERRMPSPPGSGAFGYGSSWPEYVRDSWHVYGRHDVRMRVLPSARDIARMEECVDWLRLVSPEDARIIWRRAEGMRWRQVCIHAGCARQTAWRRWAAALVTIARHLNAPRKSGGVSRPARKVADADAGKPRRDAVEARS